MTGLFKESLFTATNFGILILVEVTANKPLRDRFDPFVSATLTLMIM